MFLLLVEELLMLPLELGMELEKGNLVMLILVDDLADIIFI